MEFPINKVKICTVILLLFVSCRGSQTKTRLISEENFEDSLNVDVSNNEENILKFTKPFVDSLNKHVEGNLPYFLYDKNFDLRDSIIYNFYSAKDQFYSLRVEIFKRVNNLKVLNKIANEQTLSNKSCYKEIHEVPSDQYSNSELAELRLKEMNSGDDLLLQLGLTPSPYVSKISYDSLSIERKSL
ncbi:hypothetical protein K6119_17010 [Paracrocinitomix mangrovi]|uniref:hypothetical protein n=1 Tax=Paracrocinitomix mangrovi TaxID=2862509 RepID=UPI001C8E4094|nr:hypothetical protein [Paracrocinitomix mangrovi]UKN01427.1 hypothetical protein K6119_17010 [Paracrocinitomix mangrovi]